MASQPRIIVVAGASSNSGKTTLVCDLLRAFAGDGACEAIKLTRIDRPLRDERSGDCRAHYRFDAGPVIHSGRQETYASGKDTGRYWDAGASGVQWVIAAGDQVEQGIEQALVNVTAPRVIIEATSLLDVIQPDFAVMAMRSDQKQIKASARRALVERSIHAVYVSDEGEVNCDDEVHGLIAGLPVYSPRSLDQLIDRVKIAIS